MKNFIINYRKEWGNDGTVYTQTIKTTKQIMNNFNKYVTELKQEAAKKFIYDNTDMKILYYLETLQEGKNYTTLTTLDYFKTYYLYNIYEGGAKRDKTFERMLWRNTIIEII